ncbi:CD209 antigen-like [Oreochromis aureus]|uniref:C-type lectin domain-containing protein n=1 Tax=Oreochromis aureus TaxID=47969 RepID=A0AAZ1XRH0_OREAU|nr:CD209 antigen-like [Oreochromis aureus]
MDQAYMGMEDVSDSNVKLRRLVETSEDNSIDDEMSQTVQCETTGLGLPEAEFVKKSYCRAAVILLGLLCLFLLIGFITVVFLFTQGKSQWEMDTVLLHRLYNNLTSERNQLLTSYNNLTTEREQLLTSYNNLETEKDQLLTSYNNLTTEREQLLTSYKTLKTEKDQLLTSYNNLTTKREQLLTSYNNLKTEKNQLLTSYNNKVKERDQLQTRFEDMTKNRDNLQRKLQDCRENWVAFSDSLYKVSSEQKSWEESRQDCLQKGSNLMIINSREEQNFANQFKKYLWIGLTDSQTDGTWKWVDGTRMTTSYWNSGEPNGGRKENCGQIKAYDSQNSWNDETCSNQHFWICEKRVSQ